MPHSCLVTPHPWLSYMPHSWLSYMPQLSYMPHSSHSWLSYILQLSYTHDDWALCHTHDWAIWHTHDWAIWHTYDWAICHTHDLPTTHSTHHVPKNACRIRYRKSSTLKKDISKSFGNWLMLVRFISSVDIRKKPHEKVAEEAYGAQYMYLV